MSEFDNMTVEKYKVDGKVAILVSSGFGAGWSTWNYPQMAYDKRIVEKFLEDNTNGEEIKEFCEKLGYKSVYAGGWYQCHIELVKEGTPFKIEEYDGSEELITIEDMEIA